ncbi:MAG: NAD(P)/FAD-dependent oxidoreductase [Acidobacteriota bacterium]|nr:NAD(P)/FAD-dependent oxidoreductase [Acidobacteriota bacterium]
MGAPEVTVVGSGPNGLAAAVTLARGGLEVEVVEGADVAGGGCRSAALTLPGFVHDVCSAVHPLLAASPFFATVGLERHGVRLHHPEVAFAHPLPGGRAAAVTRSVEETAQTLGADAGRYRRLLGPVTRDAERILGSVLAPLRRLPAHPVSLARFGALGVLPARVLAAGFRGEEARAILAGAAAHTMRPLSSPITGSYALLFTALAHAAGWPLPEGGSSRIVDALVAELEAAGGHVVTGRWVSDLAGVEGSRATVLDVSPDQVLHLAGARLPARYRRALERFRYGPGVCKVDWALDGPVPWEAEACHRAGTIHLGGTFEEIARSEWEVDAGRHPEAPFCILAQPGVVDPTRAPEGKQTLWGYCHVPSGSTVDMSGRIEAQIERFAPGFGDRVLARATVTAADMARYDPNYVGGDINGGAATLRQTVFRPAARWNPYRLPAAGLYLCSASTPPGGGVHGMCGHLAARTVLDDLGIA